MGKIFRASLTDARLRARDSAGLAQRTLIASFHGKAFAAEREGEDLHIFLMTGDNVSTQTIGDGSITFTGMTAAQMQKKNEASREMRNDR